MMFTKIAAGIPERKRIDRKKFDFRVKYPRIAPKVKSEMMDLRPLQALTTCMVRSGR